MQPQISALDPGQTLNTAFKGVRRGGSGSPFEEIMAQLTQAGLSGRQTATAQASASVAPAETATNDTLTAQETPIQRLGSALRQSGQSLDNCQVAAADRDKLERVLVQSGYSLQDARQLMDRASNPDGSVNLGALFANLSQYLPTQGTQLLLNQEDAPLLTQVLKDLGLDQDKIQQFMDNLPRQGEKLVVQGLPGLLAQADPQQTKSVDQGILRDLLGRLGLEQAQVQGLVSRATDSQGRTTPQAVLALFSVAAQGQDQGLGQSLEDLASRLLLAKNGQSKAGGADQLRAKVIQTLQKIEAQVASQTQSLSRHWQQAYEQAEAALNGQGLGQGGEQGLALGQNNPQGLPLGQGLGLAAMLRQALQGQDGGLEQAPQMAGAQVLASKTAAQVLAGSHELAASQAEGQAKAAGGQGTAAAGEALAEAEAPQAATPRPVAQAQAGSDLGALSQGLTQADEALPARSVLPGYVVRQVGQQMAQMVARQENSLRLELKPPSLGEVSLELTVKDGVVKATMLTDTVAAKNILESGLDQLKQQLDMQGLKVERVEIMVNPDAQRQEAQAQSGFGRRRQGAGGQGGGAADPLEGLESAEAVLAGQTAASGRINLFA
ncbi:MAG: flagellar hook-length control protein FliK [Desulfarculus sp.]|nr:flagellar hook-length control protein FliK [Desulfarculus sp.]